MGVGRAGRSTTPFAKSQGVPPDRYEKFGFLPGAVDVSPDGKLLVLNEFHAYRTRGAPPPRETSLHVWKMPDLTQFDL